MGRLIFFLLLLHHAYGQHNFDPFKLFPPSFSSRLESLPRELTQSQCIVDTKAWLEDVADALAFLKTCGNLTECMHNEEFQRHRYALQQVEYSGRPLSTDSESLYPTWWGNYKQCGKVQAPYYSTAYCFAHVSVDWSSVDLVGLGLPATFVPKGKRDERCGDFVSTSLKVALCLPESCRGNNDMDAVVSALTHDVVNVCAIECTGPTKEKEAVFWAINSFLLLLFLLSVAAAVADYIETRREEHSLFHTQHKDLGWSLVRSFSLTRNTAEIFSMEQKNKDKLYCIDALRFITISWIIFGHSAAFDADADNALSFLDASHYFLSDVVVNAHPSVDTFFLISGLLVGFIFFRRLHSSPESIYHPFTWAMYYIHRILRLTPAYLLFIAFYIAWAPQLHGPWVAGSFTNVTFMVEVCEQSWWRNALYINNFADALNNCYPISWFLAVDTQLYVFAPIALLAIAYSAWLGIGAIATAWVFSVAACVYTVFHYDLPATSFRVTTILDKNMMEHINEKPWTRVAPYFLGLLVGYGIIRARNSHRPDKHLGRPIVALLWFLSSILALAVVFSPFDYIRGDVEWAPWLRSFYIVFSRVAWSLSVAWVIVACTFDWAGPLKWLLDHPWWGPGGRLSFCAYLVHWLTLQYFYNLRDRPSHFVSIWQMFLSSSIPTIAMSFSAAFAWSVLVEVPFGKLEALVVEYVKKSHLSLPLGLHRMAPVKRTTAGGTVIPVGEGKKNEWPGVVSRM